MRITRDFGGDDDVRARHSFDLYLEAEGSSAEEAALVPVLATLLADGPMLSGLTRRPEDRT
jgi:hypothetical protein